MLSVIWRCWKLFYIILHYLTPNVKKIIWRIKEQHWYIRRSFLQCADLGILKSLLVAYWKQPLTSVGDELHYATNCYSPRYWGSKESWQTHWEAPTLIFFYIFFWVRRKKISIGARVSASISASKRGCQISVARPVVEVVLVLFRTQKFYIDGKYQFHTPKWTKRG